MLIFVLPVVFGQGISVLDKPLQVLVGPEDSISFELTIFNEQDNTDTFEVLLSVVDWELSSDPETIEVGSDVGRTITITLTPIGEKEFKIHNVPVTIASLDRDVLVEHVLNVKVVEQTILPRINFPETINPGSSFNFEVDLENRRQESVDGLRVVLESDIFSLEEVVDLNVSERKIISFPVDFDDNTIVGDYNVKVNVYEEGELIGQVEDIFSVLLREDIVVEENKLDGFLNYEYDVVIKNNGNQEVTESYSYTAGGLASMFLDSNVEPIKIVDGEHTWESNLMPGESFELLISVDYRFFAFIILVLVALIIFIIIYTRKDIVVKKRVVSLGKNKDGSARMRIVVTVVNKGFHRLSNVMVLDSVPGAAEVPKQFGTAEPTSISKKGTGSSLIWRIQNLGAGEERLFSYVANSKRRLHQRIVLPKAHARYKKGNRDVVVSSSGLQFFGG